MTTLHIVPHTHWDREWYLPFQRFRVKLVHLLDGLLDLLEREPRLRHFMLDGQTIVLEDYLQIRPERRRQLEAQIRRGRLSVGPWTVLADEFLVSPESLVRNLLRGRSVARRFGPRMSVGYVPDPFGHIGQLPQILLGFGIDTAVFRRGLGPEPTELEWEAPDGSRVLALYLRDGYDNAQRLPTEPAALDAALRERRDSLLPHSAVSHLLLMNGSDHQEAQAELPAALQKVDLAGDEVRLSSLPEFVVAVRAELAARGVSLPVRRGELRDPSRHHLLPGVLSSRAWIKLRNHACETLLERWAEPFSAWAEWLCRDASDPESRAPHHPLPRVREPSGLLAEAWRLLLECQPHDSICGCSVDAVHDEMQARFDQVEQIGEEVTRQSLYALAAEVETAPLSLLGAFSALVALNAACGPRSGLARARLRLPAGQCSFAVVDPAGDPVPFRVCERAEQVLSDLDLSAAELREMLAESRAGRVLGYAVQGLSSSANPEGAEIELVVHPLREPDLAAWSVGLRALEPLIAASPGGRFRLVVRFETRVEIEWLAREIPSMGYRSYALVPAEAEPAAAEVDAGTRIENESLVVEFADDGTVSLEDRRSGLRFAGLLELRDRGDRGDSYNFCPVDGDQAISSTAFPARVRRVRGQTEQRLEISRVLRIPAQLAPDRGSRSSEEIELLTETVVRLVPGVPRLDVELRLENRARDHRLEVVMPVGFPVETAEYDGHFEIVKRPTRLFVGEPGWSEAPVPEAPVRAFVAARRGLEPDAPGLLVAPGGLREASVSPEGTIALTLLRCFGWLSRDDLANRRGGAGPALETPGGQSPGPQRLGFSLIPAAGDFGAAAAEARRFEAAVRGVATPLCEGGLPLAGAFLSAAPAGVLVSAVKQAEEEDEIVVRVWNSTDAPILAKLDFLIPFQRVMRARMDETPQKRLRTDERGRSLSLGLRPAEVATLCVRFAEEPGDAA